MHFKITTDEVIDGKKVVQQYDVEAIDFLGAEARAWRLPGEHKKIENVDHPEQKPRELSEVESWVSPKPQPVADPAAVKAAQAAKA